MVSFKSLVFASLAALAVASPVDLDKRQELAASPRKGCSLNAAGQTLGSNAYPHTFNNREGLTFATAGPYQEFPILTSGVYSGGSPGADRIVFRPNYNGQCVYVGSITHTGASGNNFVSCITS
ncbi:unnamed protein product [Parascedosporium putredinis]|uniref:ribonuclease T1 n=1 Tax=Parascedosporium putredinis TaxID=1442378 RepID=A0A9P1MG65_9PEZI|nr:unnamed protein product [Parascedosporium putredinis]CAI8004865.1 unnamed protein product [Parascedosporium putredinis]